MATSEKYPFSELFYSHRFGVAVVERERYKLPGVSLDEALTYPTCCFYILVGEYTTRRATPLWVLLRCTDTQASKNAQSYILWSSCGTTA